MARGAAIALARIDLRWGVPIWVALIGQWVIVRFTTEGIWSLWAWLHLATLGLLLAVAWRNRRLPGLQLLAVGLLLNLAVIAANDGSMPLAPETLQAAGQSEAIRGRALDERVPHTKDVLRTKADTPLWPFGDVFPVPAVGAMC